MGVQVKKKKTISISLPNLLEIKGMINSFRINTRGDMHRLNEIDEVCSTGDKTRLEIVENFKKANKITEDAVIDEHHTHFNELFNKLMKEEISLPAEALARFTQKELDYAVVGGNFNFGAIKLLEKYLLK